MNETDQDLLRRYVLDRSEEVFAEIVHRHLNLVYSAARRQVGSPQLAEEVAQSVFIDLARNAPRLTPGTILAAWLYQVARRTAIDVVRREARRQMREQIATEMNAMNATADDWAHVEPLLDDAMAALDETDRAAVLLRYFENKSLREVGAALGASDDAAQKRVSRAVERLREFFTKQGVKVGAGGLVVAISANAVQAAPAGLAATISAAAMLVEGTVAAASAATATKAITMTTLQKTIVGAVLVTAIGAGIYETHQASVARTRIQALEQRQAPLAEQVQQLTGERDNMAAQLAAQQGDRERLNRAADELFKLREQVGTLRKQLAGMNPKTASSDAATNSPTGAWALGTIRWIPQLSDVGLKSPAATIETYWSAIASGNPERLRECMVFRRGMASEPVSPIFARREVRAESSPLKTGMLGGVRLYSFSQSSDANSLPNVERAKIEIEFMRRVREEDALPPAPDGRPAWIGGEKTTVELMKVGGDWKILADENRVRLTLDDEDAEAVAKMMMRMPAATIEQVKTNPRLPAQTLRLYEEMKEKTVK